MSLEENKAIVRRAYEVGMNSKDWSVIDPLFSPDYVVHFIGMPPVHGYAALKKAVQSFFAAFPDIQFVVDDQLAEGDRVATRWTARGTHLGEYAGFPVASKVFPPTGRPVVFSANDIYRIENGQIVEEWNTLLNIIILEAIGALGGKE